jgi:hypothetical protein
MSAGGLFLVARCYLAVLLTLCLGLILYLRVDHAATEPLRSIVSAWEDGLRKERVIVPKSAPHRIAGGPGRSVVIEDVVDEGPVLSTWPLLFGWAFVPGRDGVEVRYRGRSVVATADDLLKMGAYDRWLPLGKTELRFGVVPELLLTAVGREIGATPEELRADGTFRRLVLRKRNAPARPEVTKETLRAAAVTAGQYLARAVDSSGRYRYETDAISGDDTDDYNWPRHSGATWYLAEIAAYTRNPTLISAAGRAARHLVENVVQDCGEYRCIAMGDRADLGSSALALLAFVELYEAGIGGDFWAIIFDLSSFLKSMQRADGEFMHLYDRVERKPIDIQLLYYTGEASLALQRASKVTGDQTSHDAARRALDRLVNPPFWYQGWRYFWGSEHWTCHAMNALWARAPHPGALRFCLDWQESVRDLALRGRDAAPEFDGATSGGPLVMPQLTGSSSRLEAAVSTLDAAKRAGVAPHEIERLEAGIREGLSFLMHFQLRPGPRHLMPSPALMHGGFPTTPTDLRVRIDYPQHAGTALLHYLKLLERENR